MYLRNIFLGIFILFSLTNCSEDLPPMNEEKLQAILEDVYVAEIAAKFNDSLMQLNKELDTAALMEAYARIYAHHNITGEELKDALDWYKDHPVHLDSVYRRIMDNYSDWRVQKVKSGDTLVLESIRNTLRPEIINKQNKQ